MTEKTMTTTTDVPQTYLKSNTHLDTSAVVHDIGDVYEWTWIMFVDAKVTNDKDVPLIEVYKYIDGTGATQTKSKLSSVVEARAEWRFWIGMGFQRITNTTNKGWKYTEDIRKRTEIEKMAKSVKSEFCKKIVAEYSDTNESEVA